jgi:hypothetical protein
MNLFIFANILKPNNTMKNLKRITLLILVISLFSCNYNKKEKEKLFEESKQELKPAAEVPIDEEAKKYTITGKTLSFRSYEMTIPETWDNVTPSNSMRLVQFVMKHHTEISIVGFYFGKRDEMIEGNIDRWKGEFVKLEKEENIALINKSNKLIKLSGIFKYKEMSMSETFVEKPGYVTLAAILITKDGPFFFKVVGPKSIIDTEEKLFVEFINSFKSK